MALQPNSIEQPKSGDTSKITGRSYRLALWHNRLLSLVALLLIALPVAKIFGLTTIDFNEGWNAFLQQRAASGLPLYSGYSPYFFSNYTPLSFYLIGELGSFTGNIVLTGRIVSLVAFFSAIAACCIIVRNAGGTKIAIGLTLLASILPFEALYYSRIGINEPQMLGMALVLWALALYLKATVSSARAVCIALLLVLAVLIKNNLLAMPLVIAFSMLFTKEAEPKLAFFGTVFAAVAVTITVVWFREGSVFYQQVFAPRHWAVSKALTVTLQFMLFHIWAVPLCIGLRPREHQVDRLILAYLVIAFALAAVFSGGDGVLHSIFHESVFAMAIIAGLAISRWQQANVKQWLLLLAMLAPNLAALAGAPFALVRMQRHFIGGLLDRSERLSKDEIAYLQARPGEALCEDNLTCFHAGKSMSVDAFNTRQAILTGRMPSDALNARITAKAYQTIIIFPEQIKSGNFEPDFYRTLEQHYRLTRSGIATQFWEPRD